MQEINTYLPNNIHVTIGAEPMDLKVEGIFVHNGVQELKNYLEKTAKPSLQELIANAGADLEGSINAFNLNAFEETQKFNQNVEEQKNYVSEEAQYWTNADIEENPFGSAKYWASQAKINYETSLYLADELNGEEI